MKTTILYDSDSEAAVITVDGRALELVFSGHRPCGIEPNEAAHWFLKRCEWHDTTASELASRQQLRPAFDSFVQELDAAAAGARKLGRRSAGDNIIEASLRGKLAPYLEAVQRVVATGDVDAEIVLNDALALNDWAVEIAVSDTVCTLKEFKESRSAV